MGVTTLKVRWLDTSGTEWGRSSTRQYRVHPTELSRLGLDEIHQRIRAAAAKAKAS